MDWGFILSQTLTQAIAPIAIVYCLAFWLAAPLIARFYTTDAEVKSLAIPLIAMVGLYHLGDALQVIAVNALRGYKRSVIPMVVYGFLLWGEIGRAHV